jgi:hypothetical protein
MYSTPASCVCYSLRDIVSLLSSPLRNMLFPFLPVGDPPHLPGCVATLVISLRVVSSPPPLLVQRYSAPQSPISVIIFRPFERSSTASISARSASESRNLNTLRLSSGCSETPRRVPLGPVSHKLTKQASRNENGKGGGGCAKQKKGGARVSTREERTDEDSANERVIQYPPNGDVGDGRTAVAVADFP